VSALHAGFSKLELTVIRLAAGPREVRSAAALPRFARFILPRRDRPAPLANPRLEALRVIAATLHRRAAIVPDEIDAFLSAGWLVGDVMRVAGAVNALVAANDQVSSSER
jgi:hypothetical protein